MTSNIGTLASRTPVNRIFSRSYWWKFERTKVPPLQKPKESPYIVGPYLKPDYLEQEYITDAIKAREINDFDHLVYKPIKVEPDETRTVRLLLIDDVEGLGVAGQVVDAPYRFGSSKLVAMKKAEYATEFAKNWYKFGPKTHKSASSALSPRTIRLLKSQIFNLPVSKDTVVEPWHISLALRLVNCTCPVEAIVKDSISDVIEDDQTLVKCTIKINNHEEVDVKFTYCPMKKIE